jgi:hypothetical protein
MKYTPDIIIIFALCIMFIIIFYTISIYENKTNNIIVENYTGNSMVFPAANLIDAKKIQTRLDNLNKQIEELTNLKNDLEDSLVHRIIGITYEYKEADKPDSTTYDISISGDAFNQTIDVKVPVGETGEPGIQGEKGIQGEDGIQGERGDEGNQGLYLE